MNNTRSVLMIAGCMLLLALSTFSCAKKEQKQAENNSALSSSTNSANQKPDENNDINESKDDNTPENKAMIGHSGGVDFSIITSQKDILAKQGSIKPEFQKSFKMIEQSIGFVGMDAPNPVNLVRVVNHLRSLGKQKAVETLYEYLKCIPRNSNFSDDTGYDQKLVWIIPLLFVAAEPNTDFPSLESFDVMVGRKEWDLHYISLKEGLSFHNASFGGTTGSRPGQIDLIKWAEIKGRIRQKPLRPLNNPLSVVDDLFAVLWKKENEELLNGGYEKDVRDSCQRSLANHLRTQSWRCISHLIPERKESYGNYFTDEGWEKLKREVAALKIQWSEKEQKYVRKKQSP